VIIATVSIALLCVIVESFFLVGFTPINNDMLADMLSFIIASLISSLVIGYVFASSIQEDSRIKAVGVVDVLSSFTIHVLVLIWICTTYGGEWFMKQLDNLFSPSGWTPYEYAAHTALLLSFHTIIEFVTIFIGLYVGSMLRKPSTKTKE
jgi:exosortase/archaeosortase